MNEEVSKLDEVFDSFYNKCYEIFMQCGSFPELCKAMHEWHSCLSSKLKDETDHRVVFLTLHYILCDAYFFTHSRCYDSPFLTFRKHLLETIRDGIQKAKGVY